MNYKITIFGLVLMLLVAFGIYYFKFAPKYLYTSISPDGVYKLKVYEERKFMTMPGDGGNNCAIIKLYKGYKKVITCDDCPCFTNEIDIEWNMDEEEVSYHLLRGIDFKNIKCLY